MNSVTHWFGVPAWAKNIVSSLTILALVLTSTGSLLAFPQDAQAADTGLLSVTATHTPSGWGEGALGDAGNAFASDDIYAQNNDEADEQGWVDFNFPGIPVGSVIDGIEVVVEAKSLDTIGCELQVELDWDGGTNGTSDKDVALTGSDSLLTFGGASDTWGRTWSTTEITDTNFVVIAEYDDVSSGTCGVFAVNGYIDLDGDGNGADSGDDGSFGGKTIIDGKVDWDNNATINGSDDSPANAFLGFTVFDGLVDVSGNGSIGSNDDGDLNQVSIDHIQARVHYTEALPPDYFITGSATVTNQTLDLSGTSGANPQKGADGTQHMAVDWDEDQDGDPDTGTGWEVAPAGGELSFTPVFAGSNPNRTFSDDWTASHTYTTAGPYTVRVMVYHGNTPGEDGDALSTISFDVVITPPEATVSATKIVCDSEADLPNMSGGANITASTASTFLGTHPNCHLQSGWTFEWAPDGTANPGNTLGAAGGAWTAFGPTNGSGVATAVVPSGSSVWVREQMQAGYVPFSGDTTVPLDNVSAEIYCSTDVENYDNYDRISSPATGSTYHCVAFNALPAPKLTVVKTVTNDNGGTKVVSDFPLFIDGNPVTSWATTTVSIGTHTVTETNDTGYAATFGGACASDGSVTLAAGETKTCTINNNDIQPALTVTKSFVNDNGGTVTIPSLFTYLVDFEQVLSGIQEFFNAGTYTISEQGNNGYTPTFGGDCVGGTVTLGIGDVKNCTIENNDQAPSLTLNKIVVNNNSGTAVESEWILTANGGVSGTLSGSGAAGTTDVVSGATFSAGTYDLSESGPPTGYTASAWVCTGGTQLDRDTVTIGLGQNVTCTITNDDIPLPLCSNGGDDDDDGLIDAADPGCHTDFLPGNPGSYNPLGTSELNESTQTSCSDGLDNDEDALIDLADPNCVTYIPKIMVHKAVVNDNFGTAIASSFTFDIANGTNNPSNIPFVVDGTFSPVGSVGLTALIDMVPGSYTVTEDAFPGYISTASGACSGTIAIGELKHCTFTNDDMPTTLTVKKVLINDNGKTNATSTFSFKLNGTGSSHFFNEVGEVILALMPGGYEVAEDPALGYEVGYIGDCDTTLALGDAKTCTITNNDKPACSDGIENDVPSDGLIDAADPACNVDNGDGGTVYDPNIESEGNETTLLMCKDYADNDGDSLIDLADPDCAAFKPVLIVKKVLSYDAEIPATFFNQFSFSLNGGESQSFDSEDGMNTLILDTKGTHTIAETNIPSNWDFGSVSCDYDGDSEGSSTVVLNGYQIYVHAGDTVTCTFTNVWNPDFACSDGIDNEDSEDALADSADPACHTDNDPNNASSYNPNITTESNSTGGGPTGGGPFGGGPLSGGGPFGGSVLGASTGQVLGQSCGLYMDKYLRRGSAKNDKGQTEKLQAFLNKWVKSNLPVTGFFGPMTEDAVKAFQASNPDTILKPWNLSAATGLVYITTLRQMNLLECPDLALQLGDLVPWSQNPTVQ